MVFAHNVRFDSAIIEAGESLNKEGVLRFGKRSDDDSYLQSRVILIRLELLTLGCHIRRANQDLRD